MSDVSVEPSLARAVAAATFPFKVNGEKYCHVDLVKPPLIPPCQEVNMRPSPKYIPGVKSRDWASWVTYLHSLYGTDMLTTLVLVGINLQTMQWNLTHLIPSVMISFQFSSSHRLRLRAPWAQLPLLRQFPLLLPLLVQLRTTTFSYLVWRCCKAIVGEWAQVTDKLESPGSSPVVVRLLH